MKHLRVLLYLLVFVILIDRFIFGYVIWQLPNETPWATNYFFNFLYEYKKVKAKKNEKPLVLIVGSSISFYSFDRKIIADTLKKEYQREFRVEYFSYPGMTPIDMYLLSDKILALKPTLVIYPLNFIDYRMHRYYLLRQKHGRLNDRMIIKDALDFREAPQSRSLFPQKALHNFMSEFSLQKQAVYLSASLFLFYRYKGLMYNNLKAVYNHRFGRNTSYHGYTGVQIPERVDYLGWTGREFSFVPKSYMVKKGIYLQVVPELIATRPFCLQLQDSNAKILQKWCYQTPGWKKIHLNPELLTYQQVKMVLSSVWIPAQATGERFDYSREEMGVRLQQTFGSEKPRRDIYFQRQERLGDLRFKDMDENEYREYFFYRLLQDAHKRPGIAYLRDIWNAKKEYSHRPFVANVHFRYLKKWLTECQKVDIPVLIINHPENPIALELYRDSAWYRGHIDYLQKLTGKHSYFFDWHSLLPARSFADFHHVTFAAMQKLSKRLAEQIKKEKLLPIRRQEFIE